MKLILDSAPYWKTALIMSLLFFSFQISCYAADITLQWDANTEPDLEGYMIYYKTGSSGEPYDSADTMLVVELSNPDNPEYTLTGMNYNEDYYIVITAYDTEGFESDYSDEIMARVDREGGGGCFIATVAFGSEVERHVKVLSKFRDRYLLSNKIGNKCVNFYYTYSPPIADYLGKHPWARYGVKCALIPVVGIAYLILYVQPVVLLFGFISMLIVVVLCVRRFSRVVK